MKKLFFTVAAICAFGLTQGQEVKFGVKAGYVNANFGSDADDGDARSSFYFGGLADISISEKFHFQPEVLYTMEGNDEDEFDLNYIRVPLMGKFYVTEAFNIQAGPQVGFIAGGGMAKDYLKSVDFGLGFGAAYELPSGLFFDARYNLGLSDLNDFPVEAGISDQKITQNSFTVGIGYRL